MVDEKQKNNSQLYNLFNDLSYWINDIDELGILVGFTIVDGLMSFKKKASSYEEQKFEEIKRVYSHLNNALEKCKVDGSYSALCDYKLSVENSLDDIIHVDEEKFDSNLMLAVAQQPFFRRKSYPDKLRRIGLKLRQTVRERGPMQKPYSWLNKDYGDVLECFTNYKWG